MELLTYSAAKAEAEKQRLLAEKYKAEAEKYKAKVLELKKSQEMERAACGIDRQETEYGRMRLQKS